MAVVRDPGRYATGSRAVSVALFFGDQDEEFQVADVGNNSLWHGLTVRRMLRDSQ
jgi:hypothetical protein